MATEDGLGEQGENPLCRLSKTDKTVSLSHHYLLLGEDQDRLDTEGLLSHTCNCLLHPAHLVWCMVTHHAIRFALCR
jgi:hypothetical protein